MRRRIADLSNRLAFTLRGRQFVRRRQVQPPPSPSTPSPADETAELEKDPQLDRTSILSGYVATLPSPQNAIDLFPGEWSSTFPAPFQDLQAGYASLFDDSRIDWLLNHFAGVTGYRVLELGPLEGGHTYLLTKAGASVVAIEAQTHAYLKCLVAKEILGYSDATFLLGDFMSYMRDGADQFDLCVASGVLYHVHTPVELLELIAKRASRLFLWTHYYDETTTRNDPAFARKFTEHTEHEHQGFRYALHRYEYLEALERSDFCGGSAPFAQWLSRDDLFGALNHVGWQVEGINFDTPDHPHGPALALVATLAD